MPTAPKQKKQAGFRSGFVGLIGPTNAGKSTLMNRLIGDKVAIVTPKPQTTRHQIKGIYTDRDAQLIFCDTPGLHEEEHLLNMEMKRLAFDTAKDMDVIGLVQDAAHPEWHWLSEFSGWKKSPAVVVFNKIDLLLPAAREALLYEARRREILFPVIAVSAVTGEGIPEFLGGLKTNVPEGAAYYPEDEITDRPWRFLAAELVRESCLMELSEEIPYGVAVLIERFKEGRLVEIDATIIVNRDGHKGIVIGKGGATLKKIGETARKAIEAQLEQKVFLKLFVRVEKHWIKNKIKIAEFVYEA